MNMFLPQQKDKDGGKMKALNNVFWARLSTHTQDLKMLHIATSKHQLMQTKYPPQEFNTGIRSENQR